MVDNFKDIMLARRSIYAISGKGDAPINQVTDIVEFALKHTPSAYNSQSGRAVVLFNDHSHKLWDIVRRTVLSLPSTKNKKSFEAKIDAFAAGYGTVLFFNDEEVTNSYAQRFPLYAENFRLWAMQSAGMIQFAVWNMLAADKLGASLQHYNPLIDDKVRQQWGLPESWKLLAQMPFGNIEAPADDDKEFVSAETSMRVFY